MLVYTKLELIMKELIIIKTCSVKNNNFQLKAVSSVSFLTFLTFMHLWIHDGDTVSSSATINE